MGSASEEAAKMLAEALRGPSIVERDGSDPRERLTPQQYAVVRRLARGDSPAIAAALEFVHPDRVGRWLKTPRFRRAVEAERELPSPPRAFPRSSGPTPKEER
jgi:hypothetical protein